MYRTSCICIRFMFVLGSLQHHAAQTLWPPPIPLAGTPHPTPWSPILPPPQRDLRASERQRLRIPGGRPRDPVIRLSLLPRVGRIYLPTLGRQLVLRKEEFQKPPKKRDRGRDFMLP